MDVNAFSTLATLSQFIANEDIEIKRVLLDTTSSEIYDPMSLETPDAKFYVFFEHKKEAVVREHRRLFELMDTAKDVATREEYYTLKNTRQRELYLLREFGLAKSDATDVIELLKPEMAAIFSQPSSGILTHAITEAIVMENK